MPCLAIHLAVAKKYLENHPEEDKEEFILGTIAPDINMENISDYIQGVQEDKNSHHFGTNVGFSGGMIEYMKKKVDFNRFFEKNDLSTTFLRAYFLHLVCDYYFFGEYITSEKLANRPAEEIIPKGYNDYNIITPKLIEQYQLEVPPQILPIISQEGHGELQILDESTIDNFIESMSNVDLEEEKEKLLQQHIL